MEARSGGREATCVPTSTQPFTFWDAPRRQETGDRRQETTHTTTMPRVPKTKRTQAAPVQATPDERWCVYLLSTAGGERTYVGATVDKDRRLRQHNGALVGGARATSRAGPDAWHRLLHVAGFPDARSALQFEWRFKRDTPTTSTGRRKRGSAPASAPAPAPAVARASPLQRRLAGLHILLCRDRATSAAMPFAQFPSGGLHVVVEDEATARELTSSWASQPLPLPSHVEVHLPHPQAAEGAVEAFVDVAAASGPPLCLGASVMAMPQ